MDIKLNNTLAKKEEIFVSQTPGKATMYVCGVTPYGHAHIGHGRCYVTFDVLFRLLKAIGYDVKYARNFTDIDDKILKKAKEDHGNISHYKKIADKFIESFQKDVDALNCEKPTFEPRVTENIPEIIEFIEGLIKEGKAYVVGHDVYFDISSFPDYGKLSGRKIEDLLAGSRVEVVKDKKNPFDFALWKGNEEGLFWKSPWGHGRPGWHIECSVLARKYLGDTIDIHGGGMDLIFPHHENEVAQSEALMKKTFARYWIHNAFVNLAKEKMSKSLGNILTLDDVFKKYDPMVLRFYYMQHHYRTPIEFSFEGLEAAKKAYKKLVNIFSDVKVSDEYKFSKEDENNPVLFEMINALVDDLNTPKLIGIIFEYSQDIINNFATKEKVKQFLVATTGLTFDLLPEEEVEITPEIQELINQREKARKEKNWKLADEIRDKLKEMGVDVQDKKI